MYTADIAINFNEEEIREINRYNQRTRNTDYYWMKDCILEEVRKNEEKHKKLYQEVERDFK